MTDGLILRSKTIMYLQKNKIVSLIFLVVMVVPLCMAQEQSVAEIERELIERGYLLVQRGWHHSLDEFYYFRQKYQNSRKSETLQKAEMRIGMVIYRFVFLRYDEPNITVEAEIVDGTGNSSRYYYKINENDDPPTLWLSHDVNEDGTIDPGEGRYAWY
jgi:hypothetical protein